MIITKYRQRTRKVLQSSLNGKNVITAINTWAILLICYTTGIVRWTQTELRTLDISTQKLMALYKCFNINDDVHRLYVPRNLGGQGLLSIEEIVVQEKLAFGEYLVSSTEPLLQKLHACNWFDCSETFSAFKSR